MKKKKANEQQSKILIEHTLGKLKKLDSMLEDIEKDFDEIEMVLLKLQKEHSSATELQSTIPKKEEEKFVKIGKAKDVPAYFLKTYGIDLLKNHKKRKKKRTDKL